MLCFRCGSYVSDEAPKCTVCGQDLGDSSKKIPTGQHAAMIFVPGELIGGRYKLIDLIGQGGVGAVYRARDTEVDVDVALKGIAPNLLQTEEEQKQFQKAIKTARKLQHPNIVRIYDEGIHQSPNRRFFTMKLLEGLTLRKIIRLRHDKTQAFSPEEIVPIFQQLAAALDYAHKQSWHGDLKPENVIVLPDLLKITDFGLVKGLPLKPFLGIAKSRSKGFPYIAPELRVEAQHIDGRVDVYSLGVILAEILTGIVYEGHFSRAFTAALEQLPTRLDGLIRRALAEHPDGRYAKASEMVKELEGALAALGNQPLPTPSSPAKEPPGGVRLPKVSSPPIASPQMAPPPPPEETGPSQAIKRPQNIEDDDSLLEVGGSQVLLLESQVHKASSEGAPAIPSDADFDSDSDTGVSLPDDSFPSISAIEKDLQARRLEVLSGLDPDDTVDDPTLRGTPDDIDTNPGARPTNRRGRRHHGGKAGLVSSGERAPRPDELLESLYSDEGDDRLIPPPLPDDADGLIDDSVSIDGQIPLHDEDLPTSENRQIARAPAPMPSSEPGHDGDISAELPSGMVESSLPSSALSDDSVSDVSDFDSQVDSDVESDLSSDVGDPVDDSSIVDAADDDDEGETGQMGRGAAEVLGLTSDEDPSDLRSSSSSPPSPPTTEGGQAIHDALTALKLHPRPDLIEDEGLRDALTRTAGTETAREMLGEQPPALPPDPDDDYEDDSMSETVTKGFSRPFEDDDLLPPPIVVPPMRPVAPPARPSQGPSPVAIAAGVAIAVVILLLGVRQFTKDKPIVDEDVVVVTDPVTPPTDTDPDVDPDSDPMDDPDADVDAGLLADAAVDAGVEAEADAGVVAASDPGKDPKKDPDGKPTPKDAVADAAAAAEKDRKEREAAEKRAREEMERREAAAAAADTKVAINAGKCPKGMATVDAGSFSFGSAGSDQMRNFGEANATNTDVAKFCIDFYEAPNGAKSLPSTGVSWNSAKNACDRSGKRLCTEVEWERACKGAGSRRFPYGNTYDADTCNTEDAAGKARPLARPVDFKSCKSSFRVYMMAGNAEEWVADGKGSQKYAKGGSSDRPDFASRCSARRLASPRSSSPMLGYRCCADPR